MFILRIEDTDVERSSDDMVSGILDGLRWLGLSWDEGPEVGGPHAPYFQSQRIERYRAAATRLLGEGQAYRWVTRRELAALPMPPADAQIVASLVDRRPASRSALAVTERSGGPGDGARNRRPSPARRGGFPRGSPAT